MFRSAICTALIFLGSLSAHPQNPRPPYPYSVEEIVFQNPSANIEFAGTLTLPASDGPFPAVILLHGSAAFDRDESYFDHKPFLLWADHLTRNGIAVLRYDKRGAGESSGDHQSSTQEDFADDALSAVECLQARSEIDCERIGLIGHSEGGMVAPLVASRSKDISFLVLMAPPAVDLEQLIHVQEATYQRVDGISEEIIAKIYGLRHRMFELLKKESDRSIAQGPLRALLQEELGKLTTSERQAAELGYGPLDNQVELFNSASFRHLLSRDPSEDLRNIKIPILTMYGTLDLVASPEQNLSRIQEVLDEVNHPDHTEMLLPKLNHAFQTCQTGTQAEFAQLEETTAPFVLTLMTDWILERME